MTRPTSAPSSEQAVRHAFEVPDCIVEPKAPRVIDDNFEKSLHRDDGRVQLLAQERGERTLKPVGRLIASNRWISHASRQGSDCDGYAFAPLDSSASILPSSRVKLDRLGIVVVAPGLQAFSRSPAIACAVSAMTGKCSACARLGLMRRVASQPSMTGRLMSISTRSGCFGASHRDALRRRRPRSRPRSRVATSRRESMSRFISLSSTRRSLAISLSSSLDRALTDAVSRWRCDLEAYDAHGRQGPSLRSRAFGEHVADATLEQFPLTCVQFLAGQNYDRNVSPFGMLLNSHHNTRSRPSPASVSRAGSCPASDDWTATSRLRGRCGPRSLPH